MEHSHLNLKIKGVFLLSHLEINWINTSHDSLGGTSNWSKRASLKGKKLGQSSMEKDPGAGREDFQPHLVHHFFQQNIHLLPFLGHQKLLLLTVYGIWREVK